MKTKIFSLLVFLSLIVVYTIARADSFCNGSSSPDNSIGYYTCQFTAAGYPETYGDSYLVPDNTTVHYSLHAECWDSGGSQALVDEPYPDPIVVHAGGSYGSSNSTSGSANSGTVQWYDLWVSGFGSEGSSYVTIYW